MNGRALGLVVWALVVLLCVPALAGAQHVDPGEPDGSEGIAIETPADPLAPASPSAVTLTSTTPYCYQTDSANNVCYINWRQITAAAGVDASMRAVTVTIGSRIRAVYRGFFQNTIDVIDTMHGPGFGVACGALGQSGDPAVGIRYGYVIQAQDSTWARVSHSGIVACPGSRLVYLPLVLKD